MKYFSIPLLYLLICNTTLQAQYDENLMFGIKAGVSRSTIANLPLILVSEDFYSGYTFDTQGLFRPVGTLFIHYRIFESPIGLEGQLSYFQHSANLHYSDVMNFAYTCKFHFHYVGVGAYVRTYIRSGLNIALGVRMGINLTPENINYTSNSHLIEWPGGIMPDGDIETRDELRSVIKGLNVSELSLMVGYEFANGLSVDLGYFHGFNDMIETNANRHLFGNPVNNTSSIQIVAGYAISVDKPSRDRRVRRL